MQLSFPFALLTRDNTVRLMPSVAEQLNRGGKVAFPKEANAIRVTIAGKTTVVLKADADTLKGAGLATAVEFGVVRNDSKGHPLRKEFETLATN